MLSYEQVYLSLKLMKQLLEPVLGAARRSTPAPPAIHCQAMLINEHGKGSILIIGPGWERHSDLGFILSGS